LVKVGSSVIGYTSPQRQEALRGQGSSNGRNSKGGKSGRTSQPRLILPVPAAQASQADIRPPAAFALTLTISARKVEAC
jgi:hypothetical protein